MPKGVGLVRQGARRDALTRLTWGRPVLLSLLIASPSHAWGQSQVPPEDDAAQSPPPASSAPDQPQAQPEVQPDEPIVITGSRIPRPKSLTAVSPVTVVQQQEVKLQGVTLTEELVNRLPMVRPSQGAFISNGASGTSTVDLRSLGVERTLVLLNGRRLAPGDPGTIAPDLNAIPSSLIQRVEVLTGGASSVYGSDAVAGVINFILDTRLQGLRLDGQASFFQHGNRLGSPFTDVMEQSKVRFPAGNAVDAGRQDVNAAFGTGFLDGRGHVTIYAGYRKLSELRQASRDYSACAFGADPNDPEILQCRGSPASFPGNFRTFFGIFQIGPDRTFQPGFVPFNFNPENFYQRPDRRYIGGGFADLELTDALKPYLEVMYMDDRSVAQIAPSANFQATQSINCDSPLLSDQQRALVCFTGNFVGEVPIRDDQGNLIGISGTPTVFTDPVTGATFLRGRLFINRRNVEGGPRRDDIRHKNLRVAGGLRGDLTRGLSYEASYVHGRVKTGAVFTNELSTSHIRRSLDVITDPSTGQPACRSALLGEDPSCVPWDIFALGGVTSEATDYLALIATREGSVTEQVGTGFVTAQLGEWGIRSPWSDEGLALNIGAEYRKDRITFEPDEAWQSGDLAGSGDLQPYSGSVRVKELFGEVRIPLITERIVDRLAIEGGYRQSWYSNPENRFTTSAYKLALDLTPVRGLRLRGSHQRAVRAPNIVDLFGPPFFYEFAEDPCAGVTPKATLEQCQRTGVLPSQYGQILANPSAPDFGGYNAHGGGNPFLEPETATTRTFGVVLEPRFLRGFNATVDWFDIELKGAVAQIGGTLIMQSCLATGDPIFCERIHRDAEGSLWLSEEGFVDDRNANIGSFKVRGLDIGASYSREIGRLGNANLHFLGTRLLKWQRHAGGLSTPTSCTGLYGFPCGMPQPRWRHLARLTWESSFGPSLSLHWRHIGKAKLASITYRPDLLFNPRDEVLSSENYFDLSGLFRIRRGYVLRFGVNNIFDRQPPIIAGTNTPACPGQDCNGNTFPQLYDPLGRFFFAGATVDFK